MALKDDKKRLNFGNSYLDSIEIFASENEKKLKDLIQSNSKLSEMINDLIEKKLVLEKAKELVKNNYSNYDSNLSNDINNINNSNYKDKNSLEKGNYNLKVIAGIIQPEEEMKFKRMIFRITKGISYPNVFDAEINEQMGNYYNIKTKKLRIFILMLPSDGFILNKSLKVCDLIKASRYKIPQEDCYGNEMDLLYKELEDKRILIKETENSIRRFLNENEDNV